MSAEDIRYEMDAYDLYENADPKGHCKYSEKPCCKCPFLACKDDFGQIEGFLANERHKLITNYYRKGMSFHAIALILNVKEQTVINILNGELKK